MNCSEMCMYNSMGSWAPMKNLGFWGILLALLVVIVVFLIKVLIIWLIWNAIMPVIFGLPTISFGVAFLLALGVSLLFRF